MRLLITIVLLMVGFSAVYVGWGAYVEFDQVFHNGTNVDDDAARMKWFAITAACALAFSFVAGAILEMWGKPRNEGGSS